MIKEFVIGLIWFVWWAVLTAIMCTLIILVFRPKHVDFGAIPAFSIICASLLLANHYYRRSIINQAKAEMRDEIRK